MRSYFALVLLGVIVGCAPTVTSTSFKSMSTSLLWSKHYTESDPRELAFIEAELGTRGQTVSGFDYLGRRTSSAYGKSLYAREATTQPSSDRDCSDFSSAAAAQAYFLSNGGPIRDPAGLDRDGDGLACEWGVQINRLAIRQRATATATRASSYSAPRRSNSSRCYVGPRGGTYTITASGNKNYGGC